MLQIVVLEQLITMLVQQILVVQMKFDGVNKVIMVGTFILVVSVYFYRWNKWSPNLGTGFGIGAQCPTATEKDHGYGKQK